MGGGGGDLVLPCSGSLPVPLEWPFQDVGGWDCNGTGTGAYGLAKVHAAPIFCL